MAGPGRGFVVLHLLAKPLKIRPHKTIEMFGILQLEAAVVQKVLLEEIFILNKQKKRTAGRASGAVAFELDTFAKTLSSHIALLGGPFILPVAKEVAAGPLGRAF